MAIITLHSDRLYLSQLPLLASLILPLFYLFTFSDELRPSALPPKYLQILLPILCNKPCHQLSIHWNPLSVKLPLSTSTMASRPHNIGIKAIEIYFPSQVHLEDPFRHLLSLCCHHGRLD